MPRWEGLLVRSNLIRNILLISLCAVALFVCYAIFFFDPSVVNLNRLIADSSLAVLAVAFTLFVGVIISAFKMRQSMRARGQAEEELRRHKDHLQKLVEERTSEIIEASRKLQQESLDKQQMANSLQESEAKYRSLVDSTEDSIYLVDRDCRYLFMNKKHQTRLGLLSRPILGHLYGDFHTAEESTKFGEDAERVFDKGESCQIEHKSERDGRFFLQTLSPVKDQSGRIIAVTVISKDITKRKNMEEELRALSLTDELTGLYNRRGFMTLADQCFKLANRMNIKVPVGYADLDGLKAINDSFGHQEGDKALVEAAEAFRESFRDSDIIARLGGDEFVVVPIANNGLGIEAALERLQKNVASRNEQEGRNYTLSVSIGITYYNPLNPCTIEEILDRGDKMMYEQKKAKREIPWLSAGPAASAGHLRQHRATGPGSVEMTTRHGEEGNGAAYLTWDDTFSVGIREIDGQHQKMIAMINGLHEATEKGYEAWMLSDLVHGLIDYASTHFRAEEQYMTKFGFAGYQEHEAEHDRFVGKVLDYQNQLSAGRAITSSELMTFLKDWLVRHILGTDKKYAQLFREKGLT